MMSQNVLHRFTTLVAKTPEGLRYRNFRGVRWALSFDFGKHPGHALFGSLVHGNEVGSVPALLRLIDELLERKVSFGGRVTFFLGNIPAFLKGTRGTDADLNRVFWDAAPASAEKDRAHELMPLINEATIFIDFHQTAEATLHPFYIFGFHRESYEWARAVGGTTKLITRKPNVNFASQSVCCDEYARRRGIPAVTLELSQKGYRHEAELLCYHTMVRTLHVLDHMHVHQVPIHAVSQKSPDFDFYEAVHKQPFDGEGMHLRGGFQNFSAVAEGEILGRHHDGRALVAPRQGLLLFPKYPERSSTGALLPPVPTEVFQLMVPCAEHPLKWLSF